MERFIQLQNIMYTVYWYLYDVFIFTIVWLFSVFYQREKIINYSPIIFHMNRNDSTRFDVQCLFQVELLGLQKYSIHSMYLFLS